MYKHQKAWEEATTKELPTGWVVHHLKGNHNDNRENNLVALPKLHDSLHWISIYFKRLNETPNLFNTMLLQLSKEHRNQKVISVGGKIRRRGYKHRSGGYNWIRNTIDELEGVTFNMKQMDDILNSIRSK